MTKVISEAKKQATTILDQANTRASNIVESRQSLMGTTEREKNYLNSTRRSRARAIKSLKKNLRKEVATLAVAGAEKILIQRDKAKTTTRY